MSKYYVTVTKTVTNGKRDISEEIDNGLSMAWTAETPKAAIEQAFSNNRDDHGSLQFFDAESGMSEFKGADGLTVQYYYNACKED